MTQTQLDLKELESKTSAEFIAEIKNALVDYTGETIPIKFVRISEYKQENPNIDNLNVLMIVGSTCHKFYFSRLQDFFLHDCLNIFDVLEFAEMFKEYSSTVPGS
ncbi:MAG TPA: hypothetical protein GX497_05485 [Bacillus bacterium]|nr:hypothetical protein [Bacillus sp. (in: firmicutes)]